MTDINMFGMRESDQFNEWLRYRIRELSGKVEEITLQAVGNPWEYTGVDYSRTDHRFFRLMGVKVYGPGREVKSWNQPMLEELPSNERGIACLAVMELNGTPYYLIRLAFEPGNAGIDSSPILFRPTFQASRGNITTYGDRVPLVGFWRDAIANRTCRPFPQPQDGGRFFQKVVDEGILVVNSTSRTALESAIASSTGTDPDDFAWVSNGILQLVEDSGGLNSHLVSLVGRAARRYHF